MGLRSAVIDLEMGAVEPGFEAAEAGEAEAGEAAVAEIAETGMVRARQNYGAAEAARWAPKVDRIHANY